MLPALSTTYGIQPWQLAGMPRAELAEYLMDLAARGDADDR